MRVWLDPWAYARRLWLRDRELPWSDAAALVELTGRVDALFQAQHLWLDVGAYYDARVASDSAQRAAMAEKARPVYALRRMLEDLGAREDFARSHRALVSSGLRAEIVLALPSPSAWLARAYAAAHGAALGTAAGDDVERAGVHVADWLRVFGEGGVRTIVVDGWGSCGDEREGLRPIVNACSFYRWSLGARELSDPSFSFRFERRAHVPRWAGDLADLTAAPDSAVARAVFVRLASDALPEAALAGVRALRAAA